MVILKIISILLLGAMTIQDFRFRAISWYLFPALFGVLLIDGLLVFDRTALLNRVFTNALVVLLQFAGMYLYLLIKNKGKMISPGKYIAMGDVLFFMILIIVFDPISYVVFTVCALTGAICWFGLQQLLRKNPSHTIPLAGIMAVALSVVTISGLFIEVPGFNTIKV